MEYLDKFKKKCYPAIKFAVSDHNGGRKCNIEVNFT